MFFWDCAKPTCTFWIAQQKLWECKFLLLVHDTQRLYTHPNMTLPVWRLGIQELCHWCLADQHSWKQKNSLLSLPETGGSIHCTRPIPECVHWILIQLFKIPHSFMDCLQWNPTDIKLRQCLKAYLKPLNHWAVEHFSTVTVFIFGDFDFMWNFY